MVILLIITTFQLLSIDTIDIFKNIIWSTAEGLAPSLRVTARPLYLQSFEDS